MPASFHRQDGPGGFVPLAEFPLHLGSDLSATVYDDAPGVAPHHATLRLESEGYTLTAEAGCTFVVGGSEATHTTLAMGDAVHLTPHASPWLFRSRSLEVPSLPAQAPHRVHGITLDGARCAFRYLPPLRGADGERRYLKILAAIGGAPHPALAQIVDGGLTHVDGRRRRWLATRWIDGKSARDLLMDRQVPVERVLAILVSLADALVHLHARGVIHRDLAPGNVIVTPGGGAVLIDYGQAVLSATELPESAGVVGTPGFVAPEEVVYGPAAVTSAVDVYGLAAVGYTLLTGAPPSCGDDVLDALASASIAPPHPSAYGIEVPAPLEELLLAALGPDPAERPDARTLAAVLADVAGAPKELA